jgi:uncharacterized membrane protein YidH (DUF202 family)
MGILMTTISAILVFVIVLIAIAILRPVYVLKEVDVGVYENRISFWRFIGVSIIITIIIYLFMLLGYMYQIRSRGYIVE